MTRNLYLKEKINFLITLFTRVVTAIMLIDSAMLLLSFGTKAKLSVIDLLCIMLIGIICTVFYIPFLREKEFSKGIWIIMKISYFLSVNIITLFTGYTLEWFCFSQVKSFCVFEAVVAGVYILVNFFFYKIDSSMADKMNKKLHKA